MIHAPFHDKALWLPPSAQAPAQARPDGTGRRAECVCGARGEVLELHRDGYRYNWVAGCRCPSAETLRRRYGLART